MCTSTGSQIGWGGTSRPRRLRKRRGKNHYDLHLIVHMLNDSFSLNLQSWLPLELHPEINALLVGFGQVVLPPASNIPVHVLTTP